MKSAWPLVSLNELLTSVNRPVPVKTEEQYRQIGIRSHGKGVFHKAPVSGMELGNKKVFWVKPGDFVLNIVFAWEGAVALLTDDEDGMIASHRFPCFRANDSRLDMSFLSWFFRTPRGVDMLGSVSPGGAGRNRTLSKNGFLTLKIPVPPLAEQRRIVARIEALAGEIEEAKSLRRKACEETDALSASSLASLLPHGTSTTALGELLAEGNPLSYGVLVPGPDVDGGIPFVRIQDLAMKRAAALPNKHIAPQVDAQYKRTRIHGGEILIGVVGSIGKVGIAPESWAGANIARAVCRIVPGPLLDRDYLAAILSASPCQNYFRETTRTLAQPTLNVGQLTQTPIPVPALGDQRRIVAELDALQAEVDALKRLQAETAAELDALLPAILDRAFKWEL